MRFSQTREFLRTKAMPRETLWGTPQYFLPHTALFLKKAPRWQALQICAQGFHRPAARLPHRERRRVRLAQPWQALRGARRQCRVNYLRKKSRALRKINLI